MPDGWLPRQRSKNVLMDRVEIVAPPPRRNRGREAMVLSGISAFCLALAAGFGFAESQAGDKGAWMGAVVVISLLVSVPVGGFGLVYGLLNWKTKLGKIVLAINAFEAGSIIAFHFLTAGL